MDLRRSIIWSANIMHEREIGSKDGSALTLWPMKRKALNWGLKFHNMMQLSPLPEASCLRVGLNVREDT